MKVMIYRTTSWRKNIEERVFNSLQELFDWITSTNEEVILYQDNGIWYAEIYDTWRE